MMRNSPILLFVLLCCNSYTAQSQTDSTKQKYNLFNPVPKSQMREMATDRPDVTENAYTLDAGHFQAEIDAFKTVRTKEENVTGIENFFNLANLKFGITESADFQVVVNTYNESRVKPGIGSSGVFLNDLTLRIKQNLWGNNKGKTALSIMPYVNVPLKGDIRLDGGVIFPFAAELGGKWNLGAQVQFDLVKNDNNKQYHAEVLNSVTLNREIMKKLEGFVESFYNYSFGDKRIDVFADGGLIFSVSDNFKLDAGLNYGLAKGSAKVYFAGLSFRY